uniref:BZIP domain-containing protein n=1 Tax=Grammatophora oceanica TaxID=210454 RepID=A0A6U5P3L7_9STRA|mmetsp:Transcript_49287/g.73516  ORF Transcript_49287/g.73516 Transcript_49287/m.73516 type:complete len:188 (+) Transcript_49287:121-684(+)|eukprot:CAMPEP_0194046086 /NCGR_PEP_ID=MMETSP0009_2-20130614/19420_1 /TAXON_ID=210454 /ORGANISM="Grammatophora oceanica, Strain CCMP 410" /LENGTH=187 /DNA_ID=CAMNT_0038691233 /DNA_START=116 /DNA_END=679 /DNA_ORIENTATION=-
MDNSFAMATSETSSVTSQDQTYNLVPSQDEGAGKEQQHKARRGKKRSKSDLSDDELHEERKAANRRSAQRCRLRQKQLIEDLTVKADLLKEQVDTMQRDKALLKSQLDSALAENCKLRLESQQTMMARSAQQQQPKFAPNAAAGGMKFFPNAGLLANFNNSNPPFAIGGDGQAAAEAVLRQALFSFS